MDKNRIQNGTCYLFFAIVFSTCTITKPSVPVDIYPKEQAKVPPPNASAAIVPSGYKTEIFMKDLIWPTSIDFDPAGNIYVAEAGYVYGDPFAPAQILKINSSGQITRFVDQLNGPVNDIMWYNNRLYISHRGKISVADKDGKVTDLVTGLPSYGDHHNNQITLDVQSNRDLKSAFNIFSLHLSTSRDFCRNIFYNFIRKELREKARRQAWICLQATE